jgi:photosystem II stability/assembly factor-like uncharacterized protein
LSRTVRLLLAGLLPALLGSTQSARAHESPHGIQLTWPTEEAGAPPFVLTNRGLIVPNLGGQDGAGSAYSLRCNEAYGVNTSAVPILLHDASGALVMATTEGVSLSADRGCKWQPGSGLPDISLGGFFQDQSAPSKLLVTTQVYEQPSQLFTSSDYGKSWTVLGTNNPYSVYRQLLASHDGQRVLAAGNRYDLASKKLLSLWSTSSDGGKTWQDEDLAAPRYPLGFHPSDPNVVFAREPNPMATIDPHDALLRSDDGGRTYTSLGELPPTNSFTATPDGSVIWVGTTGGLYRSTDQGKTFARQDEDEITAITCLAYRKDTLWVCANFAPNTNGVWTSTDQGASFVPHLLFNDVTTEVRCQGDIEMRCVQPWRDWQYELDNGFGTDAGVLPEPAPDADAGAGVPLDGGEAPAEKKSDGCGTLPGSRSSSHLPAWLLAGLALITRRRRPRRRPTADQASNA